MRLPTGAGHRGLRMIVRQNLVEYTLERPDGNIGALGETRASDTNPTANLWLFRPGEVPLDTDFGERLTGNLRGLALPGENVQEGDRLTWNGDKYRVAEKVETQDSVLIRLGLERAVND